MRFKREYILTALFAVVVIGGALAIKQVQLGGQVEEQATTSMEQSIRQSLPAWSSSKNINFTLKDVHYSSDRQWAVASIIPEVSTAADNDVVIFELKDGAYQVYKGPSSIFPSDTIQDLPADIIAYLRSIYAIGDDSTK